MRLFGLALSMMLSCCSPAERGEACAGSSGEPIVGGEPEEAFLGLSPEQQNAFVYVQFDSYGAAIGPPCSGVLIDPGWVLTARHCIPAEAVGAADVILGPKREAPAAMLRASHVELPPDAALDAVALKLDDVVPATLAVPLALSTLPADALLGARLLMGGYGSTEDNRIGWRRFVTEQVVGTGDDLLTVDGGDQSGACNGDSGGPAVWREDTPTVVGILRQGDSDCRGVDRYVHTAAFLPWLSEVVAPELRPDPEACGAFTQEGACYASDTVERAVWCELGRLQTSRCEPGRVCGWDRAQAGFRCVLPGDNACEDAR